MSEGVDNALDNALDTVVVIDGRAFEIVPPDALIIVRVLGVVGRVAMRAQETAQEFGVALFKQVANGEEGNDSLEEWLPTLFAFLAALDEDDFLKLCAALLQFSNERGGIKWLADHRPPLSALTKALVLNLQQADDIAAAIENFTPLIQFRGMQKLMKEAQPTG